MKDHGLTKGIIHDHELRWSNNAITFCKLYGSHSISETFGRRSVGNWERWKKISPLRWDRCEMTQNSCTGERGGIIIDFKIKYFIWVYWRSCCVLFYFSFMSLTHKPNHPIFNGWLMILVLCPSHAHGWGLSHVYKIKILNYTQNLLLGHLLHHLKIKVTSNATSSYCCRHVDNGNSNSIR